jgi:uncharacterized protein YggE
MNEKIKNYLGVAGIFALIALTLLLAAGIYTTYVLSKNSSPVENRSFSVSAEGKIKTTPDVAKFGFSVITEGGTNIKKLQDENSKKINDIISLIKKQGVLDKDIQTTNYNITPRYLNYGCNVQDVVAPCPPSEIAGYTVRSSVSVNVRKFEALGSILAGVADKGVNIISGPNFTIDKPDKQHAEARANAIKKAHTKAREMASAGGFKLGKLLSIQEQTAGNYRYEPLAISSVQLNSKEISPTIEPGSQDVKVGVTLRYEIK